MRQDNTCKWCNETNIVIPKVQGGRVHTVCYECGHRGPIMDISTLRIAYIKVLAENKMLKQQLGDKD